MRKTRKPPDRQYKYVWKVLSGKCGFYWIEQNEKKKFNIKYKKGSKLENLSIYKYYTQPRRHMNVQT